MRPAALALVLGCAAIAAPPASAAPLLGFNDTPSTFATHPDAVERAGGDIARIPVNWAVTEPFPGDRRWAELDAAVERLAAHDVEVLFALFAAPRWASGDCQPKPPNTCGVASGWEAAYASFGRELLNRYPGSLVQAWNEPNIDLFGSMSAARVAELTNVMFDAAPGLVIGPGAAPSSPRFIDYTAEAYRMIDPRVPVGFHLYPRSPVRSTGLHSDWRSARRIAAGRAIWVTEVGYASSSFGARGQARELARTYRYLARRGADAIIVHRLRNERVEGNPWLSSLGLLRADGSPKPAYRALRRAAS